MSTGSIKLDILLSKIQNNAVFDFDKAVSNIQRQYPTLSLKEAKEICLLIIENTKAIDDKVSLVVTAPPSFRSKAKTTKVVVKEMINAANKSILITGYSLSDYFEDLVDCIIEKSKKGVLVKFFVNDLDKQKEFDKIMRYKGKFLQIYNYSDSEDKMAALHAKVISVDGNKTLITSANLSYHGQEGNIELGSLIESQDVAKQVEDIFTKLVFSKTFTEIK